MSACYYVYAVGFIPCRWVFR